MNLSSVFGSGVYGTDWIVQKYNGAKRAQIGWFAETSTFWETLTLADKLNAYEGYVLLINRDNFNETTDAIWNNIAEGGSIYLYFPSINNIGTVSDTHTAITLPNQPCIIDREFAQDVAVNGAGHASNRNHTITDSNWRMVGVPLYQNATLSGPSAYYKWNATSNILQSENVSGKVFGSMEGYMVQYAGDLTWTKSATATPTAVAARQLDEPNNYLVRLSMTNEYEEEDHTFVELKDGASADFVLNEDLYKISYTRWPNVYVFAGAYDAGYSQVPVENQNVRVGVYANKAGQYTFSMPSEFTGTVTLIDNFLGTQTDLGLGDYTVSLNRGMDNERFSLEINIERSSATDIEGIEGGSIKDGKAHKFVRDGIMYILRDGVIYDARGARMKSER